MSEEPAPLGEIILYQTEDGRARVECRFAEETIWLSQALMSELFQKDVRTINEHLQNLVAEGEIDAGATIRKFRIVRKEGDREVTRQIDHYNLNAILAVGFRVRSERGTQFRIWATERLREYLVKGFTMDDERLRSPPGPDVPDYFDELLERIRDIRASEKRMYLRVREICSLAADYDSKRDEVKGFFQAMQNKLHFAVTGKTAAELIADRADEGQPHMGLTSWKGEVVLVTRLVTNWRVAMRPAGSCTRVPPEGRALALFQDLSAAYVIGKQLPDLPRAEGTGREPGRIAEQYMLNCL